MYTLVTFADVCMLTCTDQTLTLLCWQLHSCQSYIWPKTMLRPTLCVDLLHHNSKVSWRRPKPPIINFLVPWTHRHPRQWASWQTCKRSQWPTVGGAYQHNTSKHCQTFENGIPKSLGETMEIQTKTQGICYLELHSADPQTNQTVPQHTTRDIWPTHTMQNRTHIHRWTL